MTDLIWEDIDNYTRRLPIFGGWLVKTFEDVIHDQSQYGRGMVGGWDWRVSMCFVPDPTHEWKLEDEVKS